MLATTQILMHDALYNKNPYVMLKDIYSVI